MLIAIYLYLKELVLVLDTILRYRHVVVELPFVVEKATPNAAVTVVTTPVKTPAVLVVW